MPIRPADADQSLENLIHAPPDHAERSGQRPWLTYAIRNARFDTPAYLLKEYLRQYLLAKDKNPEILRTYLADLDFFLRSGEIQAAETLAAEWLKQWKPDFRTDYRNEFDQQTHIYYHLILAYIDEISPKFLAILDDIGDYRLQNATNREDTLLEIALERLEVSKYLVAAYRYTEAKTYLKTSYAQLNLAQQETDPQRKRELEQIAEICNHVPAHPPRNFGEALQYYWFVHLGVITELNPWDSFNPGKLDQHLYPFYEQGIEDGSLSREQARELLQAFWLKFNNPYNKQFCVLPYSKNIYCSNSCFHSGNL